MSRAKALIALMKRYFFGYGSLVNRDTHGFGDISLAEVTGWRRAWRHTGIRDVAFLTAEPDPDASIAGLIASVPDQDWAALDLRETGYQRHCVKHQIKGGADHAHEVAIYAIPPDDRAAPTEQSPILQSYVDVVLQGYLREFGEAGAQAFLDTTHGWDVPMLLDRAAPIYPRATTLSADEQRWITRALDGLPIRPLPLT